MSFLKVDHHDLRDLFPCWFPRIPHCAPAKVTPIPCGDSRCCRVFVHGLRWQHMQKGRGSPPFGPRFYLPGLTLPILLYTTLFLVEKSETKPNGGVLPLAAMLLTSYLWLPAARSSLPCYSVLNRTEEPLALAGGFYLLNPQVGRPPLPAGSSRPWLLSHPSLTSACPAPSVSLCIRASAPIPAKTPAVWRGTFAMLGAFGGGRILESWGQWSSCVVLCPLVRPSPLLTGVCQRAVIHP